MATEVEWRKGDGSRDPASADLNREIDKILWDMFFGDDVPKLVPEVGENPYDSPYPLNVSQPVIQFTEFCVVKEWDDT
jgi:hypothetical protein